MKNLLKYPSLFKQKFVQRSPKFFGLWLWLHDFVFLWLYFSVFKAFVKVPLKYIEKYKNLFTKTVLKWLHLLIYIFPNKKRTLEKRATFRFSWRYGRSNSWVILKCELASCESVSCELKNLRVVSCELSMLEDAIKLTCELRAVT